jgi:hypothetical protein
LRPGSRADRPLLYAERMVKVLTGGKGEREVGARGTIMRVGCECHWLLAPPLWWWWWGGVWVGGSSPPSFLMIVGNLTGSTIERTLITQHTLTGTKSFGKEHSRVLAPIENAANNNHISSYWKNLLARRLRADCGLQTCISYAVKRAGVEPPC